jgi:hypothetical protein
MVVHHLADLARSLASDELTEPIVAEPAVQMGRPERQI